MGDRRKVYPFWIPLFMGLVSLSSVVSKPSFSTYHKPDVILLVMGGALLGIAIGGFVSYLRARPAAN